MRLNRRSVILVTGVGVVATVAVAVAPSLRFAYRAPALKVGLDSVSALIAAMVGYLVLGRFRLDRLAARVIVAYGMFVTAVGEVLLIALPRLWRHGALLLRLATWLPLGLQLVGAAALSIAAADRFDAQIARRVSRRRLALIVIPLALIVLGAIAIHLPIDTARDAVTSAGKPPLPDVPLIGAVQVFEGALFAVAAIGFFRRGQQVRDEFAMWLALGAGLSACAHLNYAVVPSLFSRWLYTGDVIRLFAYGAWLVGAIVEVWSYWEQRAALAVQDERSRLARELHDGLAQELAFIAAEVRSWPVDDRQMLVASAAERALDESRRAISALANTSDQAFEAVLRRTLETVADRYSCTLRVSISPAASIEGPVGEELVRIAREATMNACRHGHARTVSVAVDVVDSAHRCVVRDDGIGFDSEAIHNDTGYGLRSIRDRVATIGGSAYVRSQQDRGTEVEVRW